jgi:hypothetical protein
MFALFFLLYYILPVTTNLKIRPTLSRNQETIKIPPPATHRLIFQTQLESVQEPQLSSRASESSPRSSHDESSLKLHANYQKQKYE